MVHSALTLKNPAVTISHLHEEPAAHDLVRVLDWPPPSTIKLSHPWKFMPFCPKTLAIKHSRAEITRESVDWMIRPNVERFQVSQWNSFDSTFEPFTVTTSNSKLSEIVTKTPKTLGRMNFTWNIPSKIKWEMCEKLIYWRFSEFSATYSRIEVITLKHTDPIINEKIFFYRGKNALVFRE